MDKTIKKKIKELLDNEDVRDKRKLTPKKLDDFENKLDIRISNEYRDFLFSFCSCYVKDDYFFPMQEKSDLTDESGFESMDFFYNEEFILNADEFIELWGKQVLPIGESSGDYICIGVSKENTGKIYMLYHEDEHRSDGLYLISNSFNEFICSFKFIAPKKKDIQCTIKWHL